MHSDDDRILLRRFLKEIALFKSLSDRRLNRMLEDFAVLDATKGKTIFHQSDNYTDLYIVLKGSVRAVLVNTEGQELILATFHSGDFFGEMSLLDGKPRSATVVAMEDSTLGRLKRDEFLAAVKEDPMIAIELLSALVQRMRMTDEMLGSITFLDVSQRVMKVIRQIAVESGVRDPETGCVKISKLPHKEVAALTGASREAISKSIKVLVFKGLIREVKGAYLITQQGDEA
jgi:CRP/FNR family transcriptional regulator/CRP/FNR family cyclic AMP-dependent transcriptional regulator